MLSRWTAEYQTVERDEEYHALAQETPPQPRPPGAEYQILVYESLRLSPRLKTRNKSTTAPKKAAAEIFRDQSHLVGKSYIGREGRTDLPKHSRVTRLSVEGDQVMGFTQRVFQGGVLGLARDTPILIKDILDSMTTHEREMERLSATEWTFLFPDVFYGDDAPHQQLLAPISPRTY